MIGPVWRKFSSDELVIKCMESCWRWSIVLSMIKVKLALPPCHQFLRFFGNRVKSVGIQVNRGRKLIWFICFRASFSMVCFCEFFFAIFIFLWYEFYAFHRYFSDCVCFFGLAWRFRHLFPPISLFSLRFCVCLFIFVIVALLFFYWLWEKPLVLFVYNMKQSIYSVVIHLINR